MGDNFFSQFIQNRVLLATFIAWLIAQSLKVLLGVIRQKKFDFRWFIGTGGMPSSHAASVCALATAVGVGENELVVLAGKQSRVALDASQPFCHQLSGCIAARAAELPDADDRYERRHHRS